MSHFERVYMTSLKKHFSAAISCVLISSFSFKANSAEINLTEAQNQAMRLLEEDLLNAPGGVRALGKTTRLYSYYNAAKSSNDSSKLWPTYLNTNSQQNQYQTDLSYWAGAFWNPENNNTKLVNGGPGWYLAIEPVISENYGDTYYVADFPASMKAIDVTDPTWKHVSKIKLRSQTLMQLVQSGIITKSQISLLGMQNGYFSRLSMQNIADASLTTYRKVVSEIFRKNDIQLVAYTWEKTGLQVLCKKNISTALVYIGQSPANDQKQDRATVSEELVQGLAVNYKKGHLADFEYSPEQFQKIEDSIKLYQAIKSTSLKNMSSEEIERIKGLTFGCQ